MSKNILVTGSAGFIGFHLCKKLIENGVNVIGFDNVNDYYDINLKNKRLEILEKTSIKNNWKFIKFDLLNKDLLLQVFQEYKPQIDLMAEESLYLKGL